MAKGKKQAAAADKPQPSLEIDTDAPRQGPLGERRPLTEAELIAADAAKAKADA